MKKALLLMTFTLICIKGFGQTEYGFGEGIIVTKQGDTINCQVELAVTYGKKIAYRKSADGHELSISSKEIKTLVAPYKYWENISLGKKERLMSLIVDGDTRLFTHVTINSGPSTSGQGGTYTMYNAPTIVYALKHNGSYYEVAKNNFKELIEKTLDDCQDIIDKLNSREYTIEDLEEVVTKYNSCR